MSDTFPRPFPAGGQRRPVPSLRLQWGGPVAQFAECPIYCGTCGKWSSGAPWPRREPADSLALRASPIGRAPAHTGALWEGHPPLGPFPPASGSGQGGKTPLPISSGRRSPPWAGSRPLEPRDLHCELVQPAPLSDPSWSASSPPAPPRRRSAPCWHKSVPTHEA